MEPVAEYTHVQNAKNENAIHISKEHVRCCCELVIYFELFGHTFCDIFSSYEPVGRRTGNHCDWERLDVVYPNNKLRHTLSKDLHVFGSYVTGH